MSSSYAQGSTTRASVPISKIADRYFLFSVDDVTYLRREHNICGVLLGSIPQIPQQNLFLGLPMELLPEEARLLVEKKVAYILDDRAWHIKSMTSSCRDDRRAYLDMLRSEGVQARHTAEADAALRTERARSKQKQKKKQVAAPQAQVDSIDGEHFGTVTENNEQQLSGEVFLFNSKPSHQSVQSSDPLKMKPYGVTPTTSSGLRGISELTSQGTLPVVPLSYPLYTYLHSRKYFLTPGLRFGCDYTVYPGDPLRFHSHFLAVGYEWEQEIPLLDIVGGGRLGTGVKKGFLIGGESTHGTEDQDDKVRTFCIEWGGM